MSNLPRFFALIQVLEPEERSQFRKWLTGTYHRQDDLYLIAFGAALKVDLERYRPEKFFARVYPKSVFDVVKLRRLLSELTKLLERFLAWREMEEDDILRTFFIRRAISKRKLTGHFTSLLKKDGKMDVRYDSIGMLHQYVYALDKLNTRNGSPDKTYDRDLLEALDALDRVYQSERLLLEGIYANHKRVYTLSTSSEEPIHNLELPPTERLEIEVPQLLRDILLEHTDEKLVRLLNRLDNYLALVGKMRGNYIIRQITSHLYRRLRITPDGNYHRIIFKLYKQGLDQGFLTERYSMDHTLFLNCVNLGLRNGATEWVEEFIVTYESLLNYGNGPQVVKLAKGQLALSKNQLNEAEIFLTSDFTDLNTNLIARSLLLRLFYLQSLENEHAHDELLKRLDQFDDWLRNVRQKDFTEERKKEYLKTSRVVRRLIELRVTVYNRKEKKEKLIQEIDDKQVYLPNWLRQVIRNL